MSSPPDSPRDSRPSIFDDLPPYPRILPLPSGTYTLLPIVEKCDNFELPRGPWKASDCRKRREAHSHTFGGVKSATNGSRSMNEVDSSALDDDDEEDDEEQQGEINGGSDKSTAEFDKEFLCPFFVELPRTSGTATPAVASAPSSRRGSSSSTTSAHGRPSFIRLTPMPTLRPSSPTSSHAPLRSPTFSDSTKSKKTPDQPIGFLRPSIVQAMIEDNRKLASVNMRPVWSFLPPVSFPRPVQTRRRSSTAGTPRSGGNSRRNSHLILSMGPSAGGSAAGSGANTPGGMGVTGSLPSDGTTATTISNGGAGALKDVIEGLRNIAATGHDDANANETGAAHFLHPDEAADKVYAVGFEDWVNEGGAQLRGEHVDRLVRNWKGAGKFEECLGGGFQGVGCCDACLKAGELIFGLVFRPGWRNELYSIYGPKSHGADENPLPGSNVAFTMERAACALFGLTTFGVHCTAYVEEEGEPVKMWVPRRAATKQTWPSFLDNTVAGGITAGDSPRESMIRECAEEASLPPSYVARHLRSTGCVVYTYRTEHGWLQPEVQYVYDLRLEPPHKLGQAGVEVVIPTCNHEDGEVESFELIELEEVLRLIVDGEFKPNCGVVVVDWLLRHGWFPFEADTRYLEVVTRLRRSLVLPVPA
ncbi:BQ2448_3823 [Microbotryum intermedium]|uniref:BQ2448_3823 protein n=1 Tax=Microbotryum intermedium TaxID=269621 RepID=A0A238FG09_9BASI|nr:BQ2448_3823 [Microbotryum intermedium]